MQIPRIGIESISNRYAKEKKKKKTNHQSQTLTVDTQYKRESFILRINSLEFNKQMRMKKKKSIKQEKSIRKGTICPLVLYRLFFWLATSCLLCFPRVVPLTCWIAVFVWNCKQKPGKRMRPTESPVNLPMKAKIKVLKLSQRAEGILKREKKNQCRYKQRRPYQMNATEEKKTPSSERVMHTENPNVNVIGEREHINWHENDMHDSGVVVRRSNMHQTYDRQNTTNINTRPIKNEILMAFSRECSCLRTRYPAKQSIKYHHYKHWTWLIIFLKCIRGLRVFDMFVF